MKSLIRKRGYCSERENQLIRDGGNLREHFLLCQHFFNLMHVCNLVLIMNNESRHVILGHGEWKHVRRYSLLYGFFIYWSFSLIYFRYLLHSMTDTSYMRKTN